MSSFPGNDYWDSERGGWRDGAQERWAEDHSINEETGLLDGPYPVPPWQLARGMQGLHDRAIWQARQRYMQQAQDQLRSATDMQQGALGLLSRYRAGGGAALEAGVYNQVAGGMRAEAAGSFQRADMTRPLDLLGDLRRHEGAQARSDANRASERMMLTALGTAIISSSSSQFSGGGGGGGGGGINLSSFDGSEGGGGAAQAQLEYGGQQGFQSSGGGGEASAAMLEPETGYNPQGMDAEPGVPAGGPQPNAQVQQQGSPFAGAPQPGGMKQVQGGFQAQSDPFAAPAAAPAPGGPGGAQEGPAGGGEAAAMAPMPAPVAGADRDFSRESFGAAAAMRAGGSPFAELVSMDGNHLAADLYEGDPFYRSLPTALMHRWRQRLGA